MARIEKGSRIRGLPPRIQLQQRDAATGSYPTVARCASDNRTGTNNISFNDLYTPVFTYRDNILYPSGIPSGSLYITDEEYVTFLSGSGSLRKGVGDQFYAGSHDILSGTHGPQFLIPFKDNDLKEVDAKSDSSKVNYSFYATGSRIADVGEGFTTPLWSKQKIEIPIHVAIETTIMDTTGVYGGPADSYRIAYYNVDKQNWEGIGRGRGALAFSNSLDTADFARDAAQNFSCGTVPAHMFWNFDVLEAGLPINSFGFPAAEQYHATSSQLINVSKYITKPFLCEKIILNASASFRSGDVDVNNPLFGSPKVSASVNTVFVLNQRKNTNFSYTRNTVGTTSDDGAGWFSIFDAVTIPTTSIITPSGNPLYIDSIREVVGYANILSCASGAYEKIIPFGAVFVNKSGSLSQNIYTDLVLTSSIAGTSGVNWIKQINLEMYAQNPPSFCAPPPADLGPYYNITYFFDAFAQASMFVGNTGGGRGGVGFEFVGGRSLKSDIFPSSFVFKKIVGATVNIDNKYPWYGVPNEKNINPYVLLPSDNLILAWHLPIPLAYALATTGTSSQITFAPGEYKLTLYGSYISEGKEYNDTLNQLLGSNTIHEIIGN